MSGIVLAMLLVEIGLRRSLGKDWRIQLRHLREQRPLRALWEAAAWAIAAAGVRGNHERSRTRIRAATHLLPPPANRIHREAGGVVVNPDAHPAFIATQIVHAVGDRFPVSGVANDK